MIVLIDNYDSFVHNLGRYLARLGQEVRVYRNDQITVQQVREMRPDAIVLSPGPCTPNEAGVSMDVVRQASTEIPTLGICLGHQAIAAAWGARIIRSEQPMHGRVSAIEHDGRGIFQNLPRPLNVARYHSLVVDPESLPRNLEVSAWHNSLIMGLRDRSAPVVGLQFHPESILTEDGYPLLMNFLKTAGLSVKPIDNARDEFPAPPPQRPLPEAPVTF